MRKVTAIVLAGCLALVAGACSSDGDDEAADETTTTAAVSDGDAADDGGADDTVVDPDVLGFLPEDCQFLLAGAFLNPLASLGPGGEVDFDGAADQLASIADAAPEEVAGAMEVIADGFSQLAERLEGIDLTDPQAFADPAVAAAFEDLEGVFDAEFEAAGETVSAYVEENCSG
ncbi:MAG: hypothetical protein ACSLFP_00255 [Acidimicrobiales bacterium]